MKLTLVASMIPETVVVDAETWRLRSSRNKKGASQLIMSRALPEASTTMTTMQ
jgi:hypothetical protein